MYKPVKMDNFNLHELVSPTVMDLLGSNAWGLFNEDLLLDMDRFVTDLKNDLGCKSVTINNWKWGGKRTQSGFRERTSTVGGVKSQHREGNAFDMQFKGITVQEAFDYLIANQKRYPAIKRVEDLRDAPTWLHIDAKDVERDSIYVFRA